MTESSIKEIKRERSPPYPNFGLQEAVDKLQHMHSQVKSQGVKRETLETVFGIKISLMGEIVATLKQFDLVEAPRGGTVKISPLGLRILLGTEKERREAVRLAAEKPELFRKYYKKWGQGMPTNDVCMSQLQLEDRFSKRGAGRFIMAYKETAQFVKEKEIPVSMEDISPEISSCLHSKVDLEEQQNINNVTCSTEEEKSASELSIATSVDMEQETSALSKILDQICSLKKTLSKLAPENKELVLKLLLS